MDPNIDKNKQEQDEANKENQQKQQSSIQQEEQDFEQQLSSSMFLKLKNIEGKYKKHNLKPELKRYRSLQDHELQCDPKSPEKLKSQKDKLDELENNLATEEEKQQQQNVIKEVEDNQSDQVGSEQNDKISGTFFVSAVKFGKVSNQAPARLSQPKLDIAPTKSILRSFDDNKKPGYLKKLENLNQKRYSLDMKLQTSSQGEGHAKKAISKFGQTQKEKINVKQFAEIWDKNKNFEENRLEFLDSIRGDDLNDIFTEGISCSIMLDLWRLFAAKFEDNQELCIDYIENFFNVKQFDVNMKALIPQEKQFISDFINTLYQNKHIDEDLFTIYKKYF